MNTTELIDLYCEVWSEPSAARRAELLARVWAEGATYTDPTVHATGADALLAHIAQVQAKRPGSRVERTSRVDQHHKVCRFAWHAVESNGKALPEGLDVAVLDAGGSRIQSIVGFFGPLNAPDA